MIEYLYCDKFSEYVFFLRDFRAEWYENVMSTPITPALLTLHDIPSAQPQPADTATAMENTEMDTNSQTSDTEDTDTDNNLDYNAQDHWILSHPHNIPMSD